MNHETLVDEVARLIYRSANEPVKTYKPYDALRLIAREHWQNSARAIIELIINASAIQEKCVPITWPSNYEWRCQHGHVHEDGRAAISGDFAL